MKTLRRIFILVIVSYAIAAIFYFKADDVVVSSGADKIGELSVIAAPVFVVLALVYFIFSKIMKTAKNATKKSLPNQEGQNR